MFFPAELAFCPKWVESLWKKSRFVFKMWNLVENVKSRRKCEISSKMWNFVEKSKFHEIEWKCIRQKTKKNTEEMKTMNFYIKFIEFQVWINECLLSDTLINNYNLCLITWFHTSASVTCLPHRNSSVDIILNWYDFTNIYLWNDDITCLFCVPLHLS